MSGREADSSGQKPAPGMTSWISGFRRTAEVLLPRYESPLYKSPRINLLDAPEVVFLLLVVVIGGNGEWDAEGVGLCRHGERTMRLGR